MKVPKVILAGLLALSTTGVVSAQTVIHITGSTAFRSSALAAIGHILQPGYTFGYAGTSASGANQSIYTGTTITNSIPVIIKTSWTGSVGGVETVAEQLPISTWLANTTPQSTGGTSGAPANYDSPTPPDVCLTDGFQSSTPVPTPVLSFQIVGIVPFKWVRSVGSPVSLTNMTDELGQALFANGHLALAAFTGQSSDESTKVWAIGRDADSGTRLTAYADTGFGPSSSPLQYYPTNAAGAVISRTAAGPIAGQEAVPAETLNGFFYDVGQGGYSSGGDLAVAMGATGSLAAIGGYYVTYLGTSDAATAEGLGAVEMSWKGVQYSTNAIAEGQYTFWGYEHFGYQTTYGTTSPNGKTVADQIAGQIKGVDATVAGLLLSSMHVSRPTDGGLITPNY